MPTATLPSPYPASPEQPHLPAPLTWAQAQAMLARGELEAGDTCLVPLLPADAAAGLPAFSLEFCWCPPTPPDQPFLMGSPPSEPDRRSDETQHRVQLAGFWMARHLCSQAFWQRVTGKTPSQGGKGDDHPVDTVSWDDIDTFLKMDWPKKGGRAPDGWDLRLPTESQWEYACRAGSTTPVALGNGQTLTSQLANFDGNNPYGEKPEAHRWLYRQATTPQGTFPPNDWGLHDMHGQILEWCADWSGGYPNTSTFSKEPRGPETGQQRVLCGDWNFNGLFSLSSVLFSIEPAHRSKDAGFRLALSSLELKKK